MPTRRLADLHEESPGASRNAVSEASADNGSRRKELQAAMHAIGDRLTTRWDFTYDRNDVMKVESNNTYTLYPSHGREARSCLANS